MKLTWKRDPKVTGLAAVGAAPRGSKLHDGTKTYARTSPSGGGWRSKQNGWYWIAGWDSDVPHMNTYDSPLKTEEEAKKAAREYVMANLPSNAVGNRLMPAEGRRNDQ